MFYTHRDKTLSVLGKFIDIDELNDTLQSLPAIFSGILSKSSVFIA